MKAIRTIPIALLALAFIFVIRHASFVIAQGPLTPPGAPAPTMKTLDQLEPRTPISSLPYTISAPGSYYLTANLTGTASGGIVINSEDVTLDLMGFALVGGTGHGILVSGSRRNIVIRNGTVRGWSLDGVHAADADNSRLELLNASSNGYYGIYAGSGSTVSACTASFNANAGISTGSGTLVSGCTVRSNSVHGIEAAFGNTIMSCVASFNDGNGINTAYGCTVSGSTAMSNSGHGINSGYGCTITGCTVSGNTFEGILTGNESTVSGCTATANGRHGVIATLGATVSGCTVAGNLGDGIRATSRCLIINNTASRNGDPGSAGLEGGIHTTQDGNRIEGNHTCNNYADGVLVDDYADPQRNIVVRNTSGNNGVGTGGFQFRIAGLPGQGTAGDNIVGPVVSDVSGSTANPWANIGWQP